MRQRGWGDGRKSVTCRLEEGVWSEFGDLARAKHRMWGGQASGISSRGWDVVVDEFYEAIKAQRKLIQEKGPTQREHRVGLLSTTVLLNWQVWKNFVDVVRLGYGISNTFDPVIVDKVNDELNEALLRWIKTMKGEVGQRQLA